MEQQFSGCKQTNSQSKKQSKQKENPFNMEKVYVNTIFGQVPLNTDFIIQSGDKELFRGSINDNTIPQLLSTGFITGIQRECLYDLNQLRDYYHEKALSRSDVNPIFFIQKILKAIAIDLDFKYEDHISKSKEIYCVSLLDGEIYQLDKNTIKSYKTFAAFRTSRDAEKAKAIIQPYLNKLYESK
jgi:hypothetical protein